VPADQEPPSYEVLAALVVSLRGELADAVWRGRPDGSLSLRTS
jgi:hypothetical protein